MTANPNQLFLLADHVKLSLLERQRAKSLDLEATKQDSHISRSLETLKDGLESLERQKFDQEAAGEDISDLTDQLARLRQQYGDLETDFRADPSTPSKSTTKPNDPNLSPDFAAAQTRPSRPAAPRSSSLRKNQKSPAGSKAVRFRDDPSAEVGGYRDDPDAADDSSRANLFKGNNKPYSDSAGDGGEADGSMTAATQGSMDNQQIHTYHKRVLRDQDDQLEELGRSIGRQRDLSLQMGEELEDHALLLDDVEQGVDRHQSSLDRARSRLDKFSRKAKANWSWVTITCLIIILVLLIVLTK